jgi:hypothetical protein
VSTSSNRLLIVESNALDEEFGAWNGELSNNRQS